MDGGEAAAGEWSMRINLVEAKDLLPVDESDTPDPKLKLRLLHLHTRLLHLRLLHLRGVSFLYHLQHLLRLLQRQLRRQSG